ncbi:MAG: LacI family DNA-binding transcriptional regulator [Chloroflexi bacterium]|nr:LacI family DNA-binding transcriptional regulator [Chloroflexota bacterium]
MPPRSPTSRDVARLASVSRTTVSYVLNNSDSGIAVSPATRKRVLDAARDLGYHPNAAARSLRSQKAGVVGLVTYASTMQMGANAFMPLVLDGVMSVLGGAGVKLIVEAAIPGQPDPCVGLARGGHVDALIVTGARPADNGLRVLHADGVPIVLWGMLAGSDLPFVDVDNVAAARMAVEHLLDLGHERIACITNAPPSNNSAAADRLLGYRTALESRGIVVDEVLVRRANYDEVSGFEAMRDLLAQTVRPTGVFVASDEVALGALKAARVIGVTVPDDLAIVGFDDLPIAPFVEPSLTTIRVPAREIGIVAARMIIAMMANGSIATSTTLATELIVRESSGTLRA